MPKPRKIFYCPGIISLVSLLFLFPYAIKRSKTTNSGSIILNVPNDELSSDSRTEIFSSENILNEISGKKKIEITFYEDRIENSKKIAIVQNELRKIKYTNDSETVVIVTLNNKCHYSNIISLLNICIEDRIKRYALINNQFIIPGYLQPKTITDKENIPLIMCETVARTLDKNNNTEIPVFYSPFTLLQLSSIAILWGILVALSLVRYKHRKSP